VATTPIYGFTLPTVAGDSGVWGGFLNTDITALENELARLRVPFLTPTYNVGGTTTLDCSQTTGARVHLLTVSGASTLAFSGVPSASFDCKLTLIITNGSAFVLTFPAAVTWLSGVAPTFKASGVDIVDLETKDAGTTWYATLRNPRPGVLFQDAGKTTTSGSEVSLTSYTLGAGVLAVNGQRIRITIGGAAPAGGGAVKIKFGATDVMASSALGANESFYCTVMVIRLGATTQGGNALVVKGNTPTILIPRTVPLETLSGTVLIDFRGNATVGGQTLQLDHAIIEYLAA